MLSRRSSIQEAFESVTQRRKSSKSIDTKNPSNVNSKLNYFLYFLFFIVLMELVSVTLFWVHITSATFIISCCIIFATLVSIRYFRKLMSVIIHFLTLHHESSILLSEFFPDRVWDYKSKNLVPFEKDIDISMIFCDIVGFTSWSEKVAAFHSFTLLDIIFEHFDHLAEKHGVYKIETVGDCYVGVSNYPIGSENHSIMLLNFAMDIIDTLGVLQSNLEAKMPTPFPISFRIGLHCGRASIGVIGNNKPAIHIVGDSVNVAARMEQTGHAMRIHITDTFKDEISNCQKRLGINERSLDYFDRGLMYIKGKNKMIRTFFVGRAATEIYTPKTSNLLFDLNVNFFEMNLTTLEELMTQMLHTLGCPLESSRLFIHQVAQSYNNLTYHSFNHACAVTQFCYLYVYKTDLHLHVTEDDIISLIFSALMHDSGHEGKNIVYHRKYKTDFWYYCGGRSTNEKHHIYTANNLYHDFGKHALPKNTTPEKIFHRINNLILATDLEIHDKILEAIKNIDPATFSFEDVDSVDLLFQLIIKMADLSNDLRGDVISSKCLQLVKNEHKLQVLNEASIDNNDKSPKMPLRKIPTAEAPLHMPPEATPTKRDKEQYKFIIKYVCPIVYSLQPYVKDMDFITEALENAIKRYSV